jgi:hypothetical protein
VACFGALAFGAQARADWKEEGIVVALLCCCVGIAIAVATSFATYLQQSIACLSEVSVCAVFLTTVIASLTSPSVMGLPRIVARAFPTDCKRQSNRLHLRSRTASEAAGQLHAIVRHPAVPQYLHGSKRRHIRQSLYSSKRSHQDQQHPLGYSGQHGFRAHLRSWLPRARGHAHPAHQGQCFADLWTENCRNE